MASVLLGNRLRRQIRSQMWPVLRRAGFTEFFPLQAYRRSPKTIEVVEFLTFRPEWQEPRWLGGEAYANGASFILHVGTYFVDVERLPWSEPRPRPKAQDCHRCTRLAHQMADSEVDGRTFWPGPNGEKIDEIVGQAVQAVCSRGLGYLDDYRDTAAWVKAHGEGACRNPGHQEPDTLSPEEAAEALRAAREGRQACKALSNLHLRLHLSDEHLTDAGPCSDVLAALLIGQGRMEDAMNCLDGPKQERLQQAVR